MKDGYLMFDIGLVRRIENYREKYVRVVYYITDNDGIDERHEMIMKREIAEKIKKKREDFFVFELI